MKEPLERLKGLFLIAVGCLMLVLASGDLYLSFMNPRFRWLTLAAGALLCLPGMPMLLRPGQGHHWSRLTAYAPFLALFVFSLQAADRGRAAAAETDPDLACTAPQIRIGEAVQIPSPPGIATAKEAAARRLAAEKRGALRITTAELYILADRNDPAETSRRYVLRGVAVRPKALEGSGQFLLLRTFVYCCSVDATAVGFLVQWADAAGLRDGQWVRLTGRLVKRTDPGPEDDSDLAQLPGTYFTMVHGTCLFTAESVEPVEPPEVEFTFATNEEEPYDY